MNANHIGWAAQLGHVFADPGLLERALTTPAFRASEPTAQHNQRLEFLGDAVLGLLAAEELYRTTRKAAEGSLSKWRAHMVSMPSLAAAAARIGLAPHLRRNAGEASAPSPNTLADAVEAILGAVYLDGGLEAARRVFLSLGLVANAEGSGWSRNPKEELQVYAQALRPSRQPVYETLAVEGLAHEPTFTVRASVRGAGEATGTGRNRKEAEANAAANLLAALGRLGQASPPCGGEGRPDGKDKA